MRAVFRPIASLSLAAALLTAAPALQAQTHTTSVTVTTMYAGGAPGVPMPFGTVCTYAVSPQGAPISITESGWGLVPARSQFCGNVVSGAISGGINVPDANHSYSAAPFNYNFVIQQTDASGNPTGLPVQINGVPNVTGSTFALDTYAPVVSVPAVSPVVGYNSSVPTSCVSPSVWTTPSGSAYVCAAGVYVPVSVTASAMRTAVASLTGCTTSGYAWNPATNTCTAGGGATTITIQHTFSGAGTFNYAHNLSTLYPLTTCYVNSGSPSFTASNVDVNNIAITVTAASDITCRFGR